MAGVALLEIQINPYGIAWSHPLPTQQSSYEAQWEVIFSAKLVEFARDWRDNNYKEKHKPVKTTGSNLLPYTIIFYLLLKQPLDPDHALLL